MAHHDASKVTIRFVILTGWKEIAQYLKCGVRTVQRWESDGLPIKRPHPGKRSHVVADSSQLDSWVHDNAFWRAKDRDLLDIIVRNRALRAETRKARADLHSKMQELRKEMAALRAKRHPPKAR